ncbi:phosphonoacetaldehyde hydrolase, partial [Vibrio cholerae HC-56A2]
MGWHYCGFWILCADLD